MKRSPTPARVGKRAAPMLAPDYRSVEERLGEHFGTPVKLTVGEAKGRIEITFFGDEGLQRILETLGLLDDRGVRPPKGGFHV